MSIKQDFLFHVQTYVLKREFSADLALEIQ